MTNKSNPTTLPDMAAFWTVWFLMIGLAVMLGSCKDNNFSGDASHRGKGPLVNTAQNPQQTDPLQQSGPTPVAGGTPVPGQTGSGGITTLDGSSKAPTVPMKILYNSKESGNGGYGGGFEFTLKYPSGDEKLAARFNSGTKGTAALVADACICGQVNNFDLLITADGQKRNLQGWHSEVLTSHNPPGVGGDWQIWLKSGAVKPVPPANSAVYLGGFDHVSFSMELLFYHPWKSDNCWSEEATKKFEPAGSDPAKELCWDPKSGKAFYFGKVGNLVGLKRLL